MKVLIVDQMHESIIQMPEQLGLEVDYFPDISFEEVLVKVADYEGLIIRSKFLIDDYFLGHAKKLKFIGRAGAGLDLIDLEATKKHNVEVFAANEANKVAVAEHLIGMILSLFNKIHVADSQIRNGKWLREENRGEELFGKTVGIIGFGNNGQATAERLAAFGCKILAYDINKYGFGNHQINEVELEAIFEEADIVSLHIPLTQKSRGAINESFFNRFKKPIYFCNISRGEIVVQKDLIEGLKTGKVLGACLDVLENEKINKLSPEEQESFNYLKQANNTVLTPHVAGWTQESYVKINMVLKDKIKRYLSNH